MAIQSRNYFFQPTVNTERFLSQDEPTEQVMRDFLDSIAFKTEVSDTATETSQGLVETATQVEFDNGTDNNANGYALYVRPSMIQAGIAAVVNLFQPLIDALQADVLSIQNDITTIQSDITTINNTLGENMPLGSVIMYSVGSAVPNSKWMFCEGQTLDATIYPDLFAVIGYTFGGAGNSFNLPDLSSKFIAGYDSAGAPEYQTEGQGAGANAVTLSGAESGVPAHTHTGSSAAAGAHSHDVTINKRDPNAGGSVIPSLWQDNANNDGVITITDVVDGEGRIVSTEPAHTHGITIDPTAEVAATAAHENRPEFVVMPFIIKVNS